MTKPAVKKWWQSKTLWFNAAAAALAVLESTTNLIGPALGITDAQFIAAYSLILAVVNAILRVITTQAILAPKE